ncbi:MAG TPA: A24 family peptidase [Bacillota bacterium]|nr:A24 family peptidase [Bacillota bacterium]HOL11829.1 A24 family peptidase [Bacillota bacterium]HPP60750.1 A24 family peptidase [Bacillota bacterium]
MTANMSARLSLGKCGSERNKKVLSCLITVSLSAISLPYMYANLGFTVEGFFHMVVTIHLWTLAGLDVAYRLLPNRVLISTLGFILPTKFYRSPFNHWDLVSLLCNCNPILRGNTGQVLQWKGAHAVWVNLIDGILGALLGFGIFYVSALMVPGGIGGGDIKMAGVIGFYLGVYNVLPALEVACLLSCICWIPLVLLGRMTRKDKIPFGFFMSMGTVLLLLFNLSNL